MTNHNPFVLLSTHSIKTVVYTLLDKVVKPVIKNKKKLIAIDGILSEMRLSATFPMDEVFDNISDAQLFEYVTIVTGRDYSKESWTYSKFMEFIGVLVFSMEAIPLGIGTHAIYLLLESRKVVTKKIKPEFEDIIHDFMVYVADKYATDLPQAKRATRELIPVLVRKITAIDTLTIDDIVDNEKSADLVLKILGGH